MLVAKKITLFIICVVLLIFCAQIQARDYSHGSSSNSLLNRHFQKYSNHYSRNNSFHKHRARYNHYRSYQYDHHRGRNYSKYGYKQERNYKRPYRFLKESDRHRYYKHHYLNRSNQKANKKYNFDRGNYRKYHINHNHVRQHRSYNLRYRYD